MDCWNRVKNWTINSVSEKPFILAQHHKKMFKAHLKLHKEFPSCHWRIWMESVLMCYLETVKILDDSLEIWDLNIKTEEEDFFFILTLIRKSNREIHIQCLPSNKSTGEMWIFLCLQMCIRVLFSCDCKDIVELICNRSEESFCRFLLWTELYVSVFIIKKKAAKRMIQLLMQKIKQCQSGNQFILITFFCGQSIWHIFLFSISFNLCHLLTQDKMKIDVQNQNVILA